MQEEQKLPTTKGISTRVSQLLQQLAALNPSAQPLSRRQSAALGCDSPFSPQEQEVILEAILAASRRGELQAKNPMALAYRTLLDEEAGAKWLDGAAVDSVSPLPDPDDEMPSAAPLRTLAAAPTQDLDATQLLLPMRLMEACTVQRVGQQKLNAFARGGRVEATWALAYAALAERPDASAWGLQGFHLPREERPLSTPPLRGLLEELQGYASVPSPTFGGLLVTRIRKTFQVISDALQATNPQDRISYAAAVTDLAWSAVHGVGYLLSEHRPGEASSVLDLINTFVRQHLVVALPEGGTQRTPLAEALPSELREQMKGLGARIKATMDSLGEVAHA